MTSWALAVSGETTPPVKATDANTQTAARRFRYMCPLWIFLLKSLRATCSGRRPGRPLVAKSKKTNENEQIPPAADAMLDTAVTDCQAGQGASFRREEI